MLCNTVCAVRCCVKQKPAAAESFCVFSGGGVYGWRKPADKRGLPRAMRGSPPERFTGQSGLSRVLLVADVLVLGGVEGQVADGSHDLVNSAGYDCEQDVAAGTGRPTLCLQGRVVDDETSDPSEEEGQEEACEILVFHGVNSPLLYCPISIAQCHQLVNIFSEKCHIFCKKLLLWRGDVPRRCRLGLPLGRQAGGCPAGRRLTVPFRNPQGRLAFLVTRRP